MDYLNKHNYVFLLGFEVAPTPVRSKIDRIKDKYKTKYTAAPAPTEEPSSGSEDGSINVSEFGREAYHAYH